MTRLQQRMQKNRIFEQDLEERFVLGSGAGGQKINKTSSCVYLKHYPSWIDVSCQDSRSRDRNRDIARERLCERVEEKQHAERLALAKDRAARRFQIRRQSRAEKARRRKTKAFRAEKKHYRGRVRE